MYLVKIVKDIYKYIVVYLEVIWIINSKIPSQILICAEYKKEGATIDSSFVISWSKGKESQS